MQCLLASRQLSAVADALPKDAEQWWWLVQMGHQMSQCENGYCLGPDRCRPLRDFDPFSSPQCTSQVVKSFIRSINLPLKQNIHLGIPSTLLFTPLLSPRLVPYPVTVPDSLRHGHCRTVPRPFCCARLCTEHRSAPIDG